MIVSVCVSATIKEKIRVVSWSSRCFVAEDNRKKRRYSLVSVAEIRYCSSVIFVVGGEMEVQFLKLVRELWSKFEKCNWWKNTFFKPAICEILVKIVLFRDYLPYCFLVLYSFAWKFLKVTKISAKDNSSSRRWSLIFWNRYLVVSRSVILLNIYIFAQYWSFELIKQTINSSLADWNSVIIENQDYGLDFQCFVLTCFVLR